jgi:hypothetical protein
MTTGSHSSYNALQTSVSKSTSRIGLSFQASYTFSKSIDDTSAVLGGLPANAGTILQTLPQDPLNPEADKGPSTFDVTHVFSLNLIQDLPLDRVDFLKPVSRFVTAGWQFLNITSLTSGPPFTVYSGMQQTAAGAGGTDRPDLASMPDFSTARTVREDYLAAARTTAPFSSFPSIFREAPARTRAASAPWAATPFADPASINSTLRSSRTRHLATAAAANSASCNFPRNSSMSSTSSILACRPTPCGVAALASSATLPARPARSSSPSSWSTDLLVSSSPR